MRDAEEIVVIVVEVEEEEEEEEVLDAPVLLNGKESVQSAFTPNLRNGRRIFFFALRFCPDVGAEEEDEEDDEEEEDEDVGSSC